MSRKNKKISVKHYILIAAAIIVIAVLGTALHYYRMAYSQYSGNDSVRLVVPVSATAEQLCDSLTKNLGEFGSDCFTLWKIRDGEIGKSAGVYIISPGDKAWSVAGRLKAGLSSAINVTFNNVRTMNDLAERLSRYFEWNSEIFLEACNTVLPENGFKPSQFPAAFIPDTYQFYADATATEVVNKLLAYRNTFWNDERRHKAATLGLSPIEVSTVASIVEEESKNKAEQPVIARLYLNRLEKKMRLQADPTVKFALGDFGLKRLYQKHLQYDSPYNTYTVEGLPPGPIRIPEASTIDATLNASANDYLYMCAQPGGTGKHNFTNNFEEHKKNARVYQNWLNSIGL